MRGTLSILTFGFILSTAMRADDVVLPEGKAKKVIENACQDCHGLDQVTASNMSTADWRSTVNRMVKKGAMLSPEEVNTVVDYLSVYFAVEKINVNSATSQQLQSALQFSAPEAEALVAYRKANGNFKDITDLQKVAGVDPKKLAAKKDQLSF